MRADRAVVACLALATVLATRDARSQDAPRASGDPGVKMAGPVDSNAPLPPGHPQVSGPQTDAPGAQESDEAEEPHAHAAPHGAGGGEGMFQPPADGAVEDPTLTAGSISITIEDADGHPVPNTEVTMGIIFNSVAKGESRKRVTATTDASGRAGWGGLDVGSGIAYRPMVIQNGATFSAPPFQLPAKGGMRVTLHIYPVTSEIEKTLIVSQAMLYAEVKDDRVQVQEAFTIYNFGKVAWVPDNLIVPLPPEFTAFTAQQGMTDVGLDAVPKKGAKLRGTFSPGQHVIEFRWQLPYNGEAEVHMEVGVAPHMASVRVIAPASRAMELEVAGFPPPRSTRDGMGQRVLMTERNLRREDAPIKGVQVQIRGLPTEGPAKIFTTLLAAAGVALGLVLGTRKPPQRDTKGERARLLASLEDLERAQLGGDLGPKTYERARREILDDIARTFAAEPPPTPPPPAKAKSKGSASAKGLKSQGD